MLYSITYSTLQAIKHYATFYYSSLQNMIFGLHIYVQYSTVEKCVNHSFALTDQTWIDTDGALKHT